FLRNKLPKRFVRTIINRKSFAYRFAISVVPEIGNVGRKFTSNSIGFDLIIQIERMVPGLSIFMLYTLVRQYPVVGIVHIDTGTETFVITKVIIKSDTLL